ANLMSEFGDTYLKTKGLAKAYDSYSDALEIYRALARRDADALTWQRGIADQIDNIGVVFQKQGKFDRAIENFNQSLDIRLAIAKRNQGNAISYRDRASSYYNIGEVLLPLGKAKEALANQLAALENQEKALSIDVGNPDLQLKLSLIHVSLA